MFWLFECIYVVSNEKERPIEKLGIKMNWSLFADSANEDNSQKPQDAVLLKHMPFHTPI